MFDFGIGYTELVVIALVAVIVIGPKDLPKVLRAFGRTMQKVREFQGHLDQAMREAGVDDIKKEISNLKTMNPVEDVKKEINSISASNPIPTVARELTADLKKLMATETVLLELVLVALGADERKRLGARLAAVEEHAPTRPHSHLPHSGAVGHFSRKVVARADRVWDSLEGRVTSP